MRILFTTPILEHPAAGGPQLRIENSIKALSRISELDIVYRAAPSSISIDSTTGFFKKYTSEYHVLSRPISRCFSSRCRSLAEKIANLFFGTRTTKHGEYILAHVERRQIDIIWFGYGNISYPLIEYVKTRRPDLKVICDTDSVWSRFILRELPYANGVRKLRIGFAGRKKEAEERAWVKLCDVTTAVSEVDAKYYRSIAEDPSKVHLFSNVIDMDSYALPPAPPVGFKRPSIYLAGSFGHYHSPMDAAARWMLDEVFPLILKAHPDVHFYIVGRNSEIGFGHLNGPSITATGRLETVLPFLCNTDVALVPLKFESGTRFKILEAGACKIPLVSTTLGAEGIPVIDGEHILIADEPADFANAVIKLLNDRSLANQLALHCYDLVKDNFSVESLTVEAKRIFEYLDHA